MKVLISLPVHECRRVIEDQLRNLAHYFQDPVVVLHISQSYKESADFSAFPFVIVNPTRLPTRWGNIVYLHYANISYALQRRVPFDYVITCSSNELYFRKGVEKYLATAKAFMDPRGNIDEHGTFTFTWPRKGFYVHTAMDTGAMKDPKLWAFIRKHKLPGICKSQIEGTAYSRDVAREIMHALKDDFGMEYMMQANYCAEEILLATVALAVLKRRKIVPKRQPSFLDHCHDYTPRRWIRSVRYWRGELRSERLRRYFKEIDAQDEVFAIKGVKRTYYNRVRNYIRKGVPQPKLPWRTRLAYRKADFLYDMRLLRKDLQWHALLVNVPQWCLGVLSRCIGKPKGWLKGTLRPRILVLRDWLKRKGVRI